MKKGLLIAALLMLGTQATAATFWSGGVKYGNVCRYGMYFTVYDIRYAQPVGTRCAVLDDWGNTRFHGVVTNE